MKKDIPKGPVQIKDILPQVLARYGVSRTLDHDALEKAWNEAVAPILPESLRNEITKQLFPGDVRRGVLSVKVKNTAFIQELSFHETEIVAKLNELLPKRNIRKIRYVL